MPNTYFQFKEFRIEQELSGMKVTTDACLFGAWVANVSNGSPPKRILDIGTGTGLLSLMLAQTINAKIDAVEVNKEASKEALNNFKNSPWGNRLSCTNSSIQSYQSAPYDVIICNPPFFQASQKGKSKNKNQAVHSSLLSKEDLLKSLQKLLSKNGICFILFPDREMNDFIKLAKQSALIPYKITTVRNNQGEAVFRKMVMFGFQRNECQHSEIIIRNTVGNYTDEFWYLLKDYYLEYNNPALK